MAAINKNKFTKVQIRLLIAIGSVVGLQTLAMSMLNPFINIYGDTLKGSTPFLCSLALGIFGLTNAVFQIPNGHLSDRLGRKPVILMGLALLAVGMFMGFLTSNIYLLIISRALQGTGTIMAIAYSWISDSVDDNKKSSAMGIAGIIVAIGGVSASVAGPLLYKIMSVRYMFLGNTVLILIAFFFILLGIKEKDRPEVVETISFKKQIKYLCSQKAVVLLSLCSFINSYLNIEIYNIVPTAIKNTIGVENMWMVFLPAIVCGIIAMGISVTMADKGYYIPVAIVSFIIILLGWVILIPQGIVFITIGTILNLIGYTCLTAGIPAQINKLVPQEVRGTANGILQAMTSLGVFFGPTVAGLFIQFNMRIILYIVSIVLPLVGILLSIYSNEGLTLVKVELRSVLKK
ncbi:inner membrane transport protein YajR [Clostridium puniceum]|uniref:Inner membrane transport protein YajR n=1 Tax=Clostridium puniceum TaxID=29367 RepID=A0A1S8T879_9CLOT|nr:MFS transporter [Clostridium puniceum]OOM73824.1 inner membrane transport protein YajR [Clostridium puniceum]